MEKSDGAFTRKERRHIKRNISLVNDADRIYWLGIAQQTIEADDDDEEEDDE